MIEYNRKFLRRSPPFPHPLYNEGFKNLNIQNLSYNIYKRIIFNNLTLQILPNNINLLIGKNGIGKSTLLKLINKQNLFAYDGNIILNGISIKEYSNRSLSSHIAYLPQKILFSIRYKVLELLTMSAYSRKGFTKDIVEEAIAFFNIDQYLHQDITSLSGGELQRVLLASTFIVGGNLMLLDEPFSFLDPGQRNKVYETIISLNENMNKTFLIVVNSLEEIKMFSRNNNINYLLMTNYNISLYKSLNDEFKEAFFQTFDIRYN
jgi:ABC-type cobalamin/Fe3+-siderophores transport system ATPase subunit